MTLKELVRLNRSYRRFYEDIKISRHILEELVDLARYAPSGKNLQHFKYHLAYSENLCDEIFECTSWAALIKNWNGPVKGERPVAYITVLLDTQISLNLWHDQGFAAQNILLGAVEKGFGGCVIAALNKNKLQQILKLPQNLEIVFTIAIGKPKETIILDELEAGNSSNYWRDTNEIHHVPKRKLKDIIIN